MTQAAIAPEVELFAPCSLFAPSATPPLHLVAEMLPSAPEAEADEFDPFSDDEPSQAQLAAFRRRARRSLATPARFAACFAMAVLEVEAGMRSALQLERVCEPDLWTHVGTQLARSGGPLPTTGGLLRVHCQEHAPGLADAVAVVRRAARVGFVAMRLDAWRGSWAVTELTW